MHGIRLLIAAMGLAWTLGCTMRTGDVSAGGAPKELRGLPLIFHADFEDGLTDRWEPTDPNAWQIVQTDDPARRNVFALVQQSKYEPKVRSPRNISLIKDVIVGDFILDLRARSTTKDYGHRDLCIFFGHRDPAKFYYVHMANKADPHAHSIFLVNDEPRVSIAKTRTDGLTWGDAFHHIRIVRKVEPGTIRVYFDDMSEPIMTAEDGTHTSGRVGLGSFDDTGMFDEVRLYGRVVER